MNPFASISLGLIFFVFTSYGQSDFSERPTSAARGHYKQLAALDPSPVPGQEETDGRKFPHDPATTERRVGSKPYYLEAVTLTDFNIPEPPANSSVQTRAELNYLLALQNQRTEAEVAYSLHMAGVFYNVRVKPEDEYFAAYRKNLFHIGRSIGSWFNPDNLPLTANLMANVWRDASYFIWSYKFKYLRIRPYKLEPALKNLEETDWAAYPSGHAANSYINAYIYQELAPEFIDVFLKDAYDMAHSREIIGVHYPSDSEASRIFARQFVNKLLQSEKFQEDFRAVREEWQLKAKESFGKVRLETGSIPNTQRRSCSSTPTDCKVLE